MAWFFVVPIAATLASKLPSELHFAVGAREIIVPITLPFSWMLLFGASACFGLGSLIFSVRCPSIIKRHRHLGDFQAAGEDETHLDLYAAELGLSPNYGVSPRAEFSDFWHIYECADTSRGFWRSVCFSGYFAGFLHLGWLAIRAVVAVAQLELR
jgi:hypothetical protein